MENFKNQTPIEPVIIIVTDDLVIDYPIRSITVDNDGDNDGLLNGKVIKAGKAYTFVAGDNGYYKANTFTISPIAAEEAPATTFTVLINK